MCFKCCSFKAEKQMQNVFLNVFPPPQQPLSCSALVHKSTINTLQILLFYNLITSKMLHKTSCSKTVNLESAIYYDISSRMRITLAASSMLKLKILNTFSFHKGNLYIAVCCRPQNVFIPGSDSQSGSCNRGLCASVGHTGTHPDSTDQQGTGHST